MYVQELFDDWLPYGQEKIPTHRQVQATPLLPALI